MSNPIEHLEIQIRWQNNGMWRSRIDGVFPLDKLERALTVLRLERAAAAPDGYQYRLVRVAVTEIDGPEVSG